MNKDTAKDYLPLVQALAEGKTIQLFSDCDGWEDAINCRKEANIKYGYHENHGKKV